MSDEEELEILQYKLKDYKIKRKWTLLITVLSSLFSLIYTQKEQISNILELTNLDNNLILDLGVIAILIPLLGCLLTTTHKINEKINIIEIYLNNDEIAEIREDHHVKAKELITPDDITHNKYQKKSKLSIHEERVEFRKKFHKFSITLAVMVAFILLFFFKQNLPVVMVFESFISYLIMIIDFLYYIYIVKKAKINTFSDYHVKFITKDEPIPQEQFSFMKQVLYMRHDRYSNYIYSSKIAFVGLQYFGAVLTFISEEMPSYIVDWFGIQDMPNYIPTLVILFSLFIYLYSSIFEGTWDKQRAIIQPYLHKKYSYDIYKQMKIKFGRIYNQDFKKSNWFINRKWLEYSRGLYEYNLEVLDTNKDLEVNGKKEYRYISLENSFTLKNVLINHIPRIRLTALVTFMIFFAILVWIPTNLANLSKVFIITIFVSLITLIGIYTYDWVIYKKTKFYKMFKKI